MEYMTLAKTYLECGEPKLSLKCLIQSKKFRLSAELCKKIRKGIKSLPLSFSYSFFSSHITQKLVVSFCVMVIAKLKSSLSWAVQNE